MQKARLAGVILGSSLEEVDKNIDCIKSVETDRLETFHDDHPDMFLPANLDIVVDSPGAESSNYGEQPQDESTHTSEASPTNSAWMEVSGRKRGSRKKLIFKAK